MLKSSILSQVAPGNHDIPEKTDPLVPLRTDRIYSATITDVRVLASGKVAIRWKDCGDMTIVLPRGVRVKRGDMISFIGGKPRQLGDIEQIKVNGRKFSF